MSIRSYKELMTLQTFEERFEYLRLDGEVGADTFGFDRYLNQIFYKSKEWQDVRRKIILRDSDLDQCFDLGCPDHPIMGRVIIHHMNPMQVTQMDDLEKLLDQNNLICVAHDTHNAIHYGTNLYIKGKQIIERTPNDMCPWKGAQNV